MEIIYIFHLDCPINKIYLSNKNEDLPGYVKLKLKNGKYLYYTNQSKKIK